MAKGIVGVLLSTGLFGMWAGWNFLQWRLALGTHFALVVLHWSGTRILGREQGVFLPIALGQFVLLALIYAFSLVLRPLAFSTGLFVPFWLVVSLAVGALCLARRFSFKELLPSLGSPFAAAGWTGTVIGCTYFGPDLGASGHDTLHHVYWARQILNEGFVSTRVWHGLALDTYPRAFHSLCAMWATLVSGTEWFIGPVVRFQSGLQVTLAILAGAEFLVLPRREKGQVGAEAVLTFFAVLLIYSWFCVLTPFAALDGAPRHGSTLLVAIPCLLALWFRRTLETKDLLLFVGSVPVCLGLSLAYNPAAFVQFLFFVLPFVAFLIPRFAFTRPVVRKSVLALGIGAAIACLFTLQDPWVLRRLEGLPTAPTVTDPSAVSIKGGSAFYQGVSALFSASRFWRESILTDNLLESHRQIAYWIACVLFLFLARRALSLPLRWGAGLFLGSWLGMFFPAFFSVSPAFEYQLLSSYAGMMPSLWATFAMAFWLLCLVDASLPEKAWFAIGRKARVAATLFCVLVVCQIFWVRRPGPFQPMIPAVSAEDISRLRQVELKIPPGETVGIAADYAREGERWIYPTDRNRQLLAFANRPFVFYYFLGAGSAFSPKDVELGLCNEKKATRLEFLQQHGIHYFYLNAEKPKGPCGMEPVAFGLEAAPLYSEAGHSLFRVSQ